MIRKFVVVAALCCASSGIAEAGRLQLAPFYGYRFGGAITDSSSGRSVHVEDSPAVGATLSLGLPSGNEFIEILYSYQDSELSERILGRAIAVRTEVWQIGLNREVPYDDQVKPFLVGLLGVTNMTFSGDLGVETMFSMGLGGGVKYFIAKHVAFRLDLRGYVSFIEGGGGIACNGGCVAHYEGDVFIQGEVAPSIIVAF